jgi:DNA uptake protein ComE-like DNA-binding protein
MKPFFALLALLAALLLIGGAGAAADPGKAAKPVASSQAKAKPPARPKTRVDINSATAEQLKTVPGIGEAESERIIKGRPYPTRSHLVDRKVLTYDQYQSLKDEIVALPPTAKPRKKQ